MTLKTSVLPPELNDYSVLPANKTKLERALELAFIQHLYAITAPMPELLNGYKTPAEALPYLAMENQVPDWNPEDTEQNKRHTVANQWLVTRKAGTIAGIELATEGLGGTTEIKAWHEYGGQPYHMKITTWVDKAPTLDVITSTKRRIEHAKSGRDVFTLGIGTQTHGEVFVGGFIATAPAVTLGEWAPPQIHFEGALFSGGVIQTVPIITLDLL